MYILIIIFAIVFLYFVLPTIIALIIKYYNKRNIRISGKICLTFDDGPNPLWTPVLLNVLNKWKVKATFFILGESAVKNPEIVHEISRYGHEIGYHGYSHLHPWTTFPLNYLKDLHRYRKYLLSNSGIKYKTLFRPTFGKVNILTLLYVLFYHKKIVFWDIDPEDYNCSNSIEIKKNVIKSIKESNLGAIVLLHDGRIRQNEENAKITVDAVEDIVKILRKKERHFSTISEAISRKKNRRK